MSAEDSEKARPFDMAIFLKDLYYDTKKKYRLSLIAGGKGMENIVSWVYISEDVSTTAFLNGGELIITTGVTSGERVDWLWTFIRNLIKSGTSGLILNIGRYIFEKDITPDIVRLCQKYDFPLFTMPWDTHIFDITHDYYNRIFDDTREDDNLTNAFRCLLSGTALQEEQEKTLADAGFDNDFCNVILFDTKNFGIDDGDIRSDTEKVKSHIAEIPDSAELIYALRKECGSLNMHCHVFTYESKAVVVTRTQTASGLSPLCRQLITRVRSRLHGTDIRCSSGSFADSICNLSQSFKRAKATLKIFMSTESLLATTSALPKQPGAAPEFSVTQSATGAASNADAQHPGYYADYYDMGFVRLLPDIGDRSILEAYVDEQLGKVIAYDRQHHTSLTETLREYLVCSGSVQQISQRLYCHRNTISYRIRIIRDELGYQLGDARTRFALMAAYEIMDFMNTFE